MTFLNALKKFVYKYILLKKYYRTGQCAMCGDCCRRIYVRHRRSVIKSEKLFNFLKHIHPFYSYLKIEDKDEIGLVFSCCNFDEEKHLCKIHKDRPDICKRYPDELIFQMGAELGERCGFMFSPIDTFADVLKSTEKKSGKNPKSYRILSR